MHIKKKLIFCILIITFLIVIMAIRFHLKTDEYIDTNNQIEIEENIEDSNIQIENVIETETKMPINNEIIENNNTNLKNDTDKQITKTEKNNKMKATENTSNNQDKEIQKKVQNISSSYNEKYFENGKLKKYPYFGNKYATLKVSKIGINAPIYFGVTDEILLKGVAHDSGSYFPGEEGTIIMCEHNYMNNFKRLGELKNGDIIEVETEYGDFYYKLYKSQTILETETEKLPIQENEEILMIYTCYPFNNVGHTEYRYVIYAKKI